MDINQFLNYSVAQQSTSDSVRRAQSAYITKVYSWMFAGLSLTAGTSFYVFESGLAEQLGGYMMILAIITLGLVFFLSLRIEKMSATTAMLSFLGYSLLNGVVFSTIFLAYNLGSIGIVFAIASGMFGALSLYGYTTKRDLSPIGSFLFMGLIGVLIMMVINIFIESSVLSTVFSLVGIIVFSGLTVYDTQRIKEEYLLNSQGDQIATKGAIMGALRLYLNFINLFLMLLRLLGDRR